MGGAVPKTRVVGETTLPRDGGLYTGKRGIATSNLNKRIQTLSATFLQWTLILPDPA